MRFVATLLGLRTQDTKTGAPAHFHLRYATVKTSHTPGTLAEIAPPSLVWLRRPPWRLLFVKLMLFNIWEYNMNINKIKSEKKSIFVLAGDLSGFSFAY